MIINVSSEGKAVTLESVAKNNCKREVKSRLSKVFNYLHSLVALFQT